MNKWGKSCSIDIRGCHPDIIQSAADIQRYVIELCKRIDMKRFGDCQIVKFGSGEAEGYSMVQLIETSLISGHFANATNRAFIDIFSCKDFDTTVVAVFTQEFFKGESHRMHVVLRG